MASEKTKIYGNQYRRHSAEVSIRVKFSDISAAGDIFVWLPKSCAIETVNVISVSAANVGANLTMLAGDPAVIAAMTPIVVDMPVDNAINVMVEHAATKYVTHVAGNALVIKNGCNPFTTGEVVVSITLKEFARHTGDLLFT